MIGPEQAPSLTSGANVQTNESPNGPPNERPKSRLVAALLGLLAPGMGQVFVGHTRRGVAWAALAFTGIMLLLGFSRELSPTTMVLALGVVPFIAYAGAIIDVVLISPTKHRPTSTAAVIAFAVVPVLIAPLLAVALRIFVVEAFKVPSGSMIPSVAIGDHMFVDKAVYRWRAPRRGEQIVFAYPEHPTQDFTHRAIAVSGDKLEVLAGHPIINGWTVPSCLVGDYQYVESFDGSKHGGEVFVEFLESSAYLILLDKNGFGDDYQGPYRVKPGETWVLGDNRNNSHDSRAWFGGEGGGVPASNVKGRARLIWMSPNGTHSGADLGGDPVAPSPELAAPPAACLAKRPALAQTTPPPAAAP